MSKLLLIGLDAADWKLLSEKVTQGKLPNFARLIRTGASGPLRSLHPPFSPALWASIATGKRPYEHGIVGFTYPDPSGSGLQPYTSTSLRSPALWHILSHEKKRTHVISWWNSSPADEINGVMVDETFRLAQAIATDAWSTSPRGVSPPELLASLSSKRVHPEQLPESLLRRLIPKLYEINLQKDYRVAAIAKALAEDLTTLEITLHLLREGKWDFATLCLMGLDTLAHQGMNYRAPLLASLTPQDGELYGKLVDHAYELYDEWLGLLIEAAGEGTTIMIVSDHGFHSDHRRIHSLEVEPTAPCRNHSPLGTLILHGPSIEQGCTIAQATLLDLCPTILAFFDIPAGRDMPGKVLIMPFCRPLNQKRITSWDKLKQKNLVTISQEPSPEATQAALRQLVALGYLPAFSLNKTKVYQQACCDHLLHTALAYLHDDQITPALNLLEQARQTAQQASLSRVDLLQELAFLYWKLEKERAAAANFLQFVRIRTRDARQANQQLLLKKSQLTPATELSYEEAWELRELIARAPLDEEMMIFMKLLSEIIVSKNKKCKAVATFFHLAEKNPRDDFRNLIGGKVALMLHEDQLGLRLLQNVVKERPEEAAALTLMATYYNAASSFLEAEKIAREALKIDPFQYAAWLALAEALLHQERLDESRQAALQARRSELHQSKFFELLAAIAAKKNPLDHRAFRYKVLAARARQRLDQSIKKHTHSFSKTFIEGEKLTDNRQATTDKSYQLLIPDRDRGSNNILATKEYLIITGLPRSGTSLLMQMLSAGGFPVMTDSIRLADFHNPRGYFEHEKIKNLYLNAGSKTIEEKFSILQKGAAAKIVIPLLWELPDSLPVKLIFIQRDLTEVITSQHRMAGKVGSYEQLEEVYRHYLEKTEEFLALSSWPVLRFSYNALIAHPWESARAINVFLNNTLSIEAMAAAVDPALYRVRSAKDSVMGIRAKLPPNKFPSAFLNTQQQCIASSLE